MLDLGREDGTLRVRSTTPSGCSRDPGRSATQEAYPSPVALNFYAGICGWTRGAGAPSAPHPTKGSNLTTFRLRVEEPSSSRCRPDPFWLLTSAGSSVECVPDLSSHGRGNDQENDQTDPRETHQTTATFRSGSEDHSSHRETHRLPSPDQDQATFRQSIGCQGKQTHDCAGAAAQAGGRALAVTHAVIKDRSLT
jgi:hypothetical protein